MSAVLQRWRLTFHDELFVRSRQGMMATPRAIWHSKYPDEGGLTREDIRPYRHGLLLSQAVNSRME
ncbi:hypothetical protein KXJ70_04525 [Zhongshania sp. CAU 1632]|uniref:HTH lysR-type domain-containing protein n=2 Tax=Zhongshania aquimaris TaxID=2857107 RepID=A0ABS6VNY3_9GAMM|nr:hypothetical protein [Zhongshania aquimaris]